MNEHLDKQLTAIEQALVPDGCMILESTANGLNRFSELWNQTVSGEKPLWRPFFFSWVSLFLIYINIIILNLPFLIVDMVLDVDSIVSVFNV